MTKWQWFLALGWYPLLNVLQIPRWFLIPAVAALSFVAVYAVNNSPFDILLMAGLGVFGFFLHMFKLPMPPIILGLILGPLMERNLRRALSLSDGDWSYLFSSPISIGLWVLAAISLLLPFFLGRSAKEAIVAEATG